jgi:cytochrome oxidase assembly protein ShyY1
LQLTIGNRRFRPGLLPSLAVALCVPLFVVLGNWQLDRAAQKRTRLEQFETGSVAADLGRLVAGGTAASSALARVAAAGRYAEAPQVLLSGMSYRGRPGYHVLTALRLDSGPLVMINRGWIERDFSRVAPPDVPVPGSGRREIEGWLTSLPRPGLRLAGGDVPDGSAPVVAMVYPRADDIAAVLGEPVYDGMVLLDPAAPAGFARDWRPDVAQPAKHVSYAVQWFTFAATMVALYLVLNFRRPPAPAGGDGHGSEAA